MTRGITVRLPEPLMEEIEKRIRVTRRSRNSEMIYLIEWALRRKLEDDLAIAKQVPVQRDLSPP